jgi:hypothetical protein
MYGIQPAVASAPAEASWRSPRGGISFVLVPFVPAEELMDTLKELICRIWDFCYEYGNSRERVGELIQRVGLPAFPDGIGLDPMPKTISAFCDNPYIVYQIGNDGEKSGSQPNLYSPTPGRTTNSTNNRANNKDSFCGDKQWQTQPQLWIKLLLLRRAMQWRSRKPV